MYGELLQTKFTYDDESKQVTEMCFTKISSACSDEEDKCRLDNEGKPYFDIEDFKRAR